MKLVIRKLINRSRFLNVYCYRKERRTTRYPRINVRNFDFIIFSSNEPKTISSVRQPETASA